VYLPLPRRRWRLRDAQKKLVLIVDDVRDARDLYSAYFASRGFRTITARDGNQALVLARSMRPNVIITDLAMPYMDGMEVIRQLKQNRRTRSIPVIVLTGYPERAVDRGALDAGAVAFLTKPCLPDDLENHVRRVLDSSPPSHCRLR
jgi:two-component system cell cycle response regulator DivK